MPFSPPPHLLAKSTALLPLLLSIFLLFAFTSASSRSLLSPAPNPDSPAGSPFSPPPAANSPPATPTPGSSLESSPSPAPAPKKGPESPPEPSPVLALIKDARSPPEPTPTPEPGKRNGRGSGGLSGVAKAGIVVTVLVFGAAIVSGGFIYKKRRHNIQRSRYGYWTRQKEETRREKI